jgi:ClpP class serine protease
MPPDSTQEGFLDLEKRQAVYKEIEEYRKRPLIVYATTTRGNTRSLIAGDVVREFIDQVDAIKDGDCVDVLIHSYGGDALAACKLMAVLRERFGKVGVLVPSMAFSAATIFALGGDETLT